ncbi:phosphonate ABC transporter, permease protein PhnE [soil metagenome]
MKTAEERMAEITRPEKPFATLRWSITVVLVASFLLATVTVDTNWGRLLDAPELLWRLFNLMFLPPDLGWLGRGLESMWESVAIAWIGTVIAAILSFPLAFLAAENMAGRASVGIVRQILNIFRAVPEIIFAIMLIPMLGLGPVAGALAIGISSIGTIGKLTAEVIESIDPGPVQTADAVGANRLQRWRWGVIPQIMPEVIALWLYRFEINIRVSAVLGVVGAGGIGVLLQQLLRITRDWAAAGMVLLVVIGVTILIDTISGRIRRRIIRGPTRAVDIGAGEGLLSAQTAVTIRPDSATPMG